MLPVDLYKLKESSMWYKVLGTLLKEQFVLYTTFKFQTLMALLLKGYLVFIKFPL